MKSKKKEGSKNINLALYFGAVVLFIITISIVFKAIDVVKKSKFDGSNTFTVAISNSKSIELVSVSPRDGKITKMTLNNVSDFSSLENFSIPIDSFLDPVDDFNLDTKSFFFKLMFKKGWIEKDLTTIDLLRLGIYSNGISRDKVTEESVSIKDNEKIQSFASTLFINPVIQNEKITIQITNSSGVSGLGNKLARYITNMGGSVLLVNTSSDFQEKSKIYFKNNSYTLNKLSKRLNITKEKNEGTSISDILIVIGEDRKNLLSY